MHTRSITHIPVSVPKNTQPIDLANAVETGYLEAGVAERLADRQRVHACAGARHPRGAGVAEAVGPEP